MAGAVRQPIDVPSLERYIASNVPEITVPIEIKQVRQFQLRRKARIVTGTCSSDMANRTRRTSSSTNMDESM
jgi:hypothetical protein